MRLKDRVEFFTKDANAARILNQEIFDHSLSIAIIAFVLGILVGAAFFR